MEKVIDLLLSKRILDAKAACKTAIDTLNDKKLINVKDGKVELTEAGKLLRDALTLTGVIATQTGGKVLEKHQE